MRLFGDIVEAVMLAAPISRRPLPRGLPSVDGGGAPAGGELVTTTDGYEVYRLRVDRWRQFADACELTPSMEPVIREAYRLLAEAIAGVSLSVRRRCASTSR
jgi:hypothetical protein